MRGYNGAPDEKNGFTKIPNEFLDVLAVANLSAREFRLIIKLLRLTKGWQRPCTSVSNRSLSKFTGIDVWTLNKLLKQLENKNIIHIYPQNPQQRKLKQKKEICINMHYLSWKVEWKIDPRTLSDKSTT